MKRVEVPVLGSILSTASPTVAHSAPSDALANTASDDTGKRDDTLEDEGRATGARRQASAVAASARSSRASRRQKHPAANDRSLSWGDCPAAGEPLGPALLGRALNHGKNLRKVVGTAQFQRSRRPTW